MKKTVEETDRFALNVASKQGWELVWDSSFTSGVVEGLTHNFNHFGYYLCPCDGETVNKIKMLFVLVIIAKLMLMSTDIVIAACLLLLNLISQKRIWSKFLNAVLKNCFHDN